MKDPSIFLCPEITRENALTLMEWLQDEDVRKFLSDSHDVSAHIEQTVNRVNLPVLTHLFNQRGRFYMAQNKQKKPVGFVRLVKKGNETEIVVVIGDHKSWGKRLGTITIRESLKIAFFELRSEKVIAKIHNGNIRSIRAFISANFKIEQESPVMKTLTLTMDAYLESIKARTLVPSEIYITEIDRDRLKKMIDNELNFGNQPNKTVSDLKSEIERAKIVRPQLLPQNVITMNSRALLRLDQKEMEVSLVYPKDAGHSNDKLSVLNPVGTAILGYNEGQKILWEVPSGITEIYIQKVLYQPEAAGDYHL